MSLFAKPSVLVTGATGFVGRAVCRALVAREVPVHAALRSAGIPVYGTPFPVGELDGATDWHAALKGCDTVIHTAARAHVMREKNTDPLAEYRRINTEATLHLAREAARARVKRFVFISSAKVMGEGRALPYTDADHPAPQGPYALSKWEAEEGLREIAAGTGMELTILRPPLVYGPGVKANFLNLMRWIDRGRPLPFGTIDNRRSLIGLDNLVDAILLCATHPAAANRSFLVADADSLSTPALARAIAEALGRRAKLYSIPPSALRLAGTVLGKGMAVDRLLGSFALDTRGLQNALHWAPPFTTHAGLKKTADWFRAENPHS